MLHAICRLQIFNRYSTSHTVHVKLQCTCRNKIASTYFLTAISISDHDDSDDSDDSADSNDNSSRNRNLKVTISINPVFIIIY